jgi:hypothetical protein
MFKLLISCVILALSIIVIAAIVKVIMGVQENKNSPTDENPSIDDVIDELEFKIYRTEVLAEKGVKDTEEHLKFLKGELKKAKKSKNK